MLHDLVEQDESTVAEGLGSGFGMTNEHQANLRSKLYTMLGDRGTVAAAAATTANTNANGNSIIQKQPSTSSSNQAPTSSTSSTLSSQLRIPSSTESTPGAIKSAGKYNSTLDSLDDTREHSPDHDHVQGSNDVSEDGDGGISAAAASLEPLGWSHFPLFPSHS